MDGNELRAVLTELGITQADFARLVGVTPRAITLWVSNERAISGPAEVYLRLLLLLPANLRQVELSRLKEKGGGMRDGIFGIRFQGQQGVGVGVLIFDNGRVYGTDTEGVRYDGEYLYNEISGLAEVKLKITFPPNVVSIFGISNPYEWSFDVTTSVNPKVDSGPVAVKSSLGRPINAEYKFLRTLPEAA